MASMNEKYDTALIGILQNEGQIAKFLDVLLGFLYRRFVSIFLFPFDEKCLNKTAFLSL